MQNLDQHASPTTFDKICYYLEKEFLDVIADEMQVWFNTLLFVTYTILGNSSVEVLENNTTLPMLTCFIM